MRRSTSASASMLAGALMPGQAEVFGLDAHDGHPVVDAGDPHTLDFVDCVAGRQEGSTRRAGDVKKVDRNRRVRARYTVDCRRPVVANLATWRLHMGDGQRLRVLHPDPHRRHVTGRLDQPFLEGERANAGEQVAAVLVVGDLCAVWPHLQEQVVDIGVRRGPTSPRPQPSTSADARRPCRRSRAGQVIPSRPAARRRASRGRGAGRRARKYRPLDVPPRMTEHRIAVWLMSRRRLSRRSEGRARRDVRASS